MSNYRDYDEFVRRHRSGQSTSNRLLTFLRTRSTETWIFFVAGLVLGGIVM